MCSPMHDRDAPRRANRVDRRALPSAIWLADFTVMALFYEGWLSRGRPRRFRVCAGAGRCRRRSSSRALHAVTAGAPAWPGTCAGRGGCFCRWRRGWRLGCGSGKWLARRAGARGEGRPRWMTKSPRGALAGPVCLGVCARASAASWRQATPAGAAAGSASLPWESGPRRPGAGPRHGRGCRGGAGQCQGHVASMWPRLRFPARDRRWQWAGRRSIGGRCGSRRRSGRGWGSGRRRRRRRG